MVPSASWNQRFIMKYVLGIQTAEFRNTVAIIETDGKQIKADKVCSVEIGTREQTVERLGDSVKKMLKQIKADVGDIGLVAICLGPGSYTGTRGGVAFAKGLCQFSGVPLVGVSAFEVLRENVRGAIKKGRDVIFMLDAKNERIFYVIKTDQNSFDLVRFSLPQVAQDKQIEADSVLNVIGNIKSETLFVGSGALANKALIKGKLKEKAKFLPRKYNLLIAEQVAKVGLEKFRRDRSIFSKDYLLKIKPLYILPPNITESENVKR